MTAPRYLSTREVSEMADVKIESIRRYRVRGSMPAPDDYVGGFMPVWKLSTIQEWLKTRPSVGRPMKGQR